MAEATTSISGADTDRAAEALIAEIRALRAGAAPPGEVLEGFVRAFHFKTPAAYFSTGPVSRHAREMVDAAVFIDGRPAGEIWVRVVAGGSGDADLLQVNMDDQPFVLDSVLETLRVLEVPVHGYLHPILRIDRDGERRLVGALPRTAPGPHESFLHFRIGPLETDAERRELEQEIRRALADAKAAVRDFAAMRKRAEDVARELLGARAASLAERRDMEEAAALLHWLTEENFIFLGCRGYRFFEREGKQWIQVEEGSGLGILSVETASAFARPTPMDSLSDDLRRRMLLRVFPLLGKSNRPSRVHRRVPMDYVGIKRLGPDGSVAGEHRFLGLFTARAFNQPGSEIPVLRRKLAGVIERAQVLEGSHDHSRIIATFNGTPKAELFATSIEDIGRSIDEVLAVQTRDEVRVFCQQDELRQRVAVMVILPRERFSTEIRERIQAALQARFRVPAIEYRLALSEEAYSRLHFYFQDTTGKLIVPTRLALQNAVARAVRTWDDDFAELLAKRFGPDAGARLARVYREALPAGYRVSVAPRLAVSDVHALERVRETGGVEIGIYDAEEDRSLTSIRIVRAGEKFVLSSIMPVLTNLGLLVVDESTFAIEGRGAPRCHLHAFQTKKRDGEPLPRELRPKLREAVLALLAGHYENDPLSRLVAAAGLSVRQVEVVRAYVHYSRQIRSPHPASSVASALSNYPDLAALLVEYFEAKFRPGSPPGSAAERLDGPLAALERRINDRLDAVSDLNEDRIVRGLLGLMRATTRTSYYQRGESLPRLSLKIRSGDIAGMPRPVPWSEIFVHSAEMEGVHLRSGPVARGGIRWSDRRDDYRTEVLGLMRTQVTKNAIIVPVGSKGGFVIKCGPDEPSGAQPDVGSAYREYIRGLLDLTDNRVGDEIAHPPDTVVYDGPDPYLVVAADKGTATFSDVANGIAADYRFWLDDAFASGGSHGYDHKKLGITARGAWECARWHLFEDGRDVDSETFTVIGIGDMSGDVFGNGMLLSRQAKLLAALDHRHVFIDPDPDPQASYVERRRLFETPDSSWADYRRDVMSAGGGVFPRNAKKVVLTPEMRALLQTDAPSMTGEELVRAVLAIRADLLYNGGIGTFVKATGETHADARDEKNDAVRVDACELRCRIVVEGGNLGLTQAARVEFARGGGRINADFIDNSGGVDLSDHEVNIKIALGRAVRDGALSFEERNRLLERIAPDVCELVLRTNRIQARILALEELVSGRDLSDHLDLLEDLQASGIIDRHLDRFPDADELARRRESAIGLVRPELATLLAFAKIDIGRALRSSAVMDEPGFEIYLPSYFPQDVVEVCASDLGAHPLRREIAATVLTNEIVHRGGIAFVSRLRRDHGAGTVDVVRAYRATDLLLDARGWFAEVSALVDRRMLSLEGGAALTLAWREAAAELAGWLLVSWPRGADGGALDVAAVVERLSPWVDGAAEWLEDGAPDSARQRFGRRVEALEGEGASAELAARAARLDLVRMAPALDAVFRAIAITDAGAASVPSPDREAVAVVFLGLHEALCLSDALEAIARQSVDGPRDRRAVRTLARELLSGAVELTRIVASRCDGRTPPAEAVAEFVQDRWSALRSYIEVLESAERAPAGLASYVLLVDRLRRLAQESGG